MKFQFRTFALTLLATAVAAGAPAQADEIADFYKDKKITAISGGGAGGGFSLLRGCLDATLKNTFRAIRPGW